MPMVIQNNSSIQLSPLCIVNEVTMKGPITLRSSDPNVAMDISVHPSIVAIRDERVMAAQFEFNDVSMAETELILKSLDPNKATGHDQIPTCVLRDGASVLAGPIARLINTVIDNACVPTEWKLAEICPMFKRDDEFDKS